MTDIHSLITCAKDGDLRALETLCVRMYPRVERLVHESMDRDYRRGRSWLSALFSTGDVVQEVFIGALRDIKEIRGQTESALLSYLATLTKNRIVDAIRFFEASRRDGRRVSPVLENDVDLSAGYAESPEEAAITQEEIARYYRALSTFSERDRGLLRERIENRTPFEDIAKLLAYASADSTRKAFHVAQAKLLLRLGRDE